MKIKLRILTGLLSASGLGFFIYQGSTNYIVLSLIMFAFSGFVITFADFVINKNYEINMNEKELDNKNKNDWRGVWVNKKNIIPVLLAFLLMLLGSFCLGMAVEYLIINGQTHEVTQTQNVTIQNPISSLDSKKININSTSISELESLPGIGESKARDIINNAPYKSIYDLKEKCILGEKLFNSLEGMITCD